MFYRIGIDGGGTKTVGLLINSKGEILKKAEAGPANFLSAGLDNAVKNIETVIYELCKAYDLNLSDVKIGLGIAGIGREKDKKTLNEALSGRNFDYVIEIDALAALMAATEGENGVAVIAGTGSIAFGIKDGTITRVGGWGHLLGDEGSGYYIGKRAMIEACRSYDGRSPHSKIHEMVLDNFACDSHEDFISFIYEQPPLRQQVAGLARKVADLANKEKDLLAIQILEDTAAELADLAITAIKKLNFGVAEFPLGLIGGVFKAGSYVMEPFRKKILQQYPFAKIDLCRLDPAIGAALMIEPKFAEEALVNLRKNKVLIK